MAPTPPRSSFLCAWALGAGVFACLLGVAPAVAGAQAKQEAAQAEPSPSPSPIAAEESRAERLRQRRLGKSEKLVPYQPTFLERQLLAIEKAERPSLLNINYMGLYPTIASVGGGGLVAPGVRFWRPDMGRSRVSVHASAALSPHGYELYDLLVGQIPHRGKALPKRSTKGDDVYELGELDRPEASRWILYGSLRYRHSPQEAYFGPGPDSRVEDRTTYLHQDAAYEVLAGYQLGRHVVLTVRPGYLQVFTTGGTDERYPTIGEVFDDTTAPGLAEQPDFLTVTGSLLLDYRDEPFNPHRGAMLALALSRFDDRGGNEFRFNRVAVDGRAYFSLGSPQRVLALRALGNWDDPGEGARVPFYLQSFLGTSHQSRGFARQRYRAEKTLSLQAEYRWEAAPALELVLFTDAGQVASTGTSLDLDNLKTSYGFGVRLKTFDTVLLRFDVAWSREDTRVFLRFSPSF